MLKRFITFCCVLLLAVVPVAASFGNSAFAEEEQKLNQGFAFLIDPSEQTLDLEPGISTSGTVKVKNTGSIPIEVKMSVKPFQAANENYDLDFSTENIYTKMHNWISFPESAIHLEPGEERDCVYNVDVPTNIPGGGQYAAIIAESQGQASGDGMFRRTYQLMSLIFAHVAGEEHVGGVLMNHRLPNFLLGSPFSVSATFKNDGNVDFRALHTLTIIDFFTRREVLSPNSVDDNGKPVGHATVAVLPTTSRTNTLTWKGAPQLGVFRVIQSVSFLEENQTFEQIVFVCPIWLAAGVVFLIALMIIWLITRARVRRRQSRRSGVI